jgi:hypothetical protein
MSTAESKVERVFFTRLMENEDLLEAVIKRVERAKVKAGFFFLIGSLKKARLGFFNGQEYQAVEIDRPLEIVSCMGNVSLDEENHVVVHAHMVVSTSQGEAFGGHLLSGCVVSFTAELVLVECAQIPLRRVLDEKTGLRLWSL